MDEAESFERFIEHDYSELIVEQLMAWGATEDEAEECLALSRRITEIYEAIIRRSRVEH